MAGGLRYGIEVRAGQPADAPEMARLMASGGVAISPQDLPARLEAVRADPASAVLVATGYGGLNGFIAFCWSPVLHTPHQIARITFLVVDAEERRRGIGRLLLKAASQAARTTGCDTMEWAIPPDQEAAHAFCRTTGFSPDDRVYRRTLRRRG